MNKLTHREFLEKRLDDLKWTLAEIKVQGRVNTEVYRARVEIIDSEITCIEIQLMNVEDDK